MTVDIEFGAYITIFKNAAPLADFNCSVDELTNSTELIRWYINDGYPNNARCIYDLLIVPGTEVVLVVHSLTIETNVDTVSYPDFQGNPVFLDFMDTVTFEPLKNGSSREVHFTFASDGSVMGQHFDILFWTVCKNLNFKFSLDSSEFAFRLHMWYSCFRGTL